MTVMTAVTLLMFAILVGYDICLTYRFRKLRRDFAIVEQIMVPFLEWIEEVKAQNQKYVEDTAKK